MKRGQVTIYIIIGLIALVAVVLTLYVNQTYLKSILGQKTTRLSQIPAEFEPVQTYSQSCLNEIAPIAIDVVLIQGGYSHPQNYITLPENEVAYWYASNKDISPKLETISSEIGKFIDENFNDCLIIYPDSGYLIEQNSIKTEVKITKGKVTIQLIPNIQVTHNNVTYNLKNINTEINSELYDVYANAKKIISSQVEKPGKIDYSVISTLDYPVEFISFPQGYVYALSSNNYILMFANKI